MKTIKVTGWSKNGNIEYLNILLPAKRVVCPQCEGDGIQVNPAIDGHGLTSQDFVEDPEFEEAYFSGAFDIPCELCKGQNVIDEVDEALSKTRLSWWKGLIRYYNAIQIESDARREFYEEQRMAA